ncbi:MAG: hypothetical protein LBQ94_07235 [Treponema sp.]|jgi:outer membrane protein OmpA-like peptidoglycan-associated protein|nr:hypothetical protein [Treponema sp.]
MRKNLLVIIVLVVFLTVSGFAQTNENESEYPKAGFFFGAGWSSGIFTSDKLSVYSDFDILQFNPVKIGAYYEIPLGLGNFFAGLEAGFASGSSFGGAGGVSFLPLNANATFAFGIADILYIGPSLKAGIMGLLGHSEYNLLPLLGAGVDLELRYKYFPLSVYAAAGVNAYPTTNGANVLPTVEVGVRFPRGAFGRSSASTQSSGTTPGSGLTQGAGTQTTTTPPPPPVITTPPAPVRQPFQFTPSPPNSRLFRLEDGRQGLFSNVYFEPDTGVLIERYRVVMEEAGQLLAANPQLQLILRTYTALFGTAGGRLMVATERGEFCRDYFVQNYGIAPSRITIEPYASEKDPEDAKAGDWATFRCAELIVVEGN